MFGKYVFEPVVFPTEGKTTKKFQIVFHLNNTRRPLKYILQHYIQSGFRATPIVFLHKEILFLYLFVSFSLY